MGTKKERPKAAKADTPKLIPALAYMRRSTAGKVKKTGQERQEKSIGQQRAELEKLAAGRYEILGWYQDDGRSGTTLDRDGFKAMLDRIKQRCDCEAIICDHLDRLFRADADECSEIIRAMKRAGVRILHTNAQRRYDLGRTGYDIAEAIPLLVDVLGAHQYSRQLARRITLAMRNRVIAGKPNAAPPPYGYRLAYDAKGNATGLVFGPASERKIVLWLYEEFVAGKSINWLTTELNRKGVPGRRGGKWCVAAVGDLLKRETYVGSTVFNSRKSGKFFYLDQDGELAEKTADWNGSKYSRSEDGVIRIPDTHKALVPKALFDKAQKRFAAFKDDYSHRPRASGAALSGLIFCGECSARMYPVRPGGRKNPRPYRVYRCANVTDVLYRKCDCKGTKEVREALIVPAVLATVREELHKLLESPAPQSAESIERRELHDAAKMELRGRRNELEKQIEQTRRNMRQSGIDERVFKMLTDDVAAMLDDLQKIDQELAAPSESELVDGFPMIERKDFKDFVERFDGLFASDGKKGRVKTPPTAIDIMSIDQRQLNKMLRELGIKVTLFVETKIMETKFGPNKGGKHIRHFPTKFRVQGGRYGEKGMNVALSSARLLLG